MNKLANSFKLLTNKNVEYELRIGSYKNGKYTSHLPKESYDKVLNNKSLFSSNKNATTTSITLITQYKGILLNIRNLRNLIFKSIGYLYFYLEFI